MLALEYGDCKTQERLKLGKEILFA